MAAPFKVSISCLGEKVVFEASPILTENRAASWSPYDIVHLPTTIYAYKSTSARTFTLSGKLVSRNTKEANDNARIFNLIRSWVLPDFGGTGATPPIVSLTAFNNSNIDNLACIITDYGWSFDDATDYVFTGVDPMPVIGTLTVNLAEIYSPQDITAVTPWKIKSSSGGIIGETPSLSSLGDSFSGIANGDFQKAVNALDQVNTTFQTADSIVRNAVSETLAATRNMTNSSQISEKTSSISNQFLTSLVPGETGGVPNGINTARSVGDTFGRVARTLSGPIFG